MRGRYPGVALVTGASSGIGAAFARRLAAEGYDLVLVARRLDRLSALAATLPTRTLCVPADLSAPEGPEAVEAAVRGAGVQVGVLVLSAGFGLMGPFEGLDRDRQLSMVDLHCRSQVELIHRFLPGMLAQGRGAVVLVSSISAFQASPWLSTYGATKAFTLSLAEALHVELGPRGVDVLGLCPGPTRTGWQEVAGVDADPPEALWAQPEEVVNTALRALGRRSGVVHGAQNRLLSWLVRLVPRSFAASSSGRVMRRSSKRLAALLR